MTLFKYYLLAVVLEYNTTTPEHCILHSMALFCISLIRGFHRTIITVLIKQNSTVLEVFKLISISPEDEASVGMIIITDYCNVSNTVHCALFGEYV